MKGDKQARVLAVASGGGHWVQLQRLTPAFDGCDVRYVTTLQGLEDSLPGKSVTLVRDASRTDKLGLIVLALQIAWIIFSWRPSVVVTTGAAPGVIALRFGKLFGTRTIWIDSVANVNELSMSGLLAKRYSDLWLTQWPHLVEKYEGLSYRGGVI